MQQCQYCSAPIAVGEIVARILQEEFVGMHIVGQGIVYLVTCKDDVLRKRVVARGEELRRVVKPCCFACWQKVGC
jgi:hypothetical protein